MATEVLISPAAGNAPFPTQGGVGSGVGFDAVDFRRFWSKAYREGVHSAAAWRVTEAAAGPGATVEIAADVDGAFIQGDAVTDQGLYYVAPHSAVITLDVPTPDTTNPRVDRVVLQVRDAAHDGSGSTDARALILEGAPTAGATKENAAGAPAVPDGALLLATYEVPASASPAVVANTDILDMRAFGLGGDIFVGDLRFSFRGSPGDGWSECDFGELRRDQHFRLFSEIGVSAGPGDGSQTFNKPDMRGRVPMGDGTAAGAAGATAHVLGERTGEERHTLSVSEMPSHGHTVPAYTGGAQNPVQAALPGQVSSPLTLVLNQATSAAGGNAAHNNLPPSTVGKWYVFTGSVAVG